MCWKVGLQGGNVERWWYLYEMGPRQRVQETLSKIPNTQKNRAGGVAQVVECQLSKHGVLSSNKEKEREKKKRPGAGDSCL
jgi:hypothetical protein